MRYIGSIAGLFMVGAILAACDDSSSPGSPAPRASGSPGATLPFDTEDGDTVARAIIPPLRETLGQDWGLDEEDAFDGSPFATLGQFPSCDAIRDRAVAISETLDATSAGRAQRGYSFDEAGDVSLNPAASVIVHLYPSVEEATAMAAAYADLFEDEDFATCTRETAATDAHNPVEVTVGPPAATPPANGSGVSLRVESPNEDIDEVLLAELYAWSVGNAFVEVVVGGTEHAVDPSTAPKILDATHDRLLRGAAGEVLATPEEDG